MEAIDNYANDNIVRSVAYNALEKRYQHQFLALLPISSRLLRQRVRLLLENGQPESSEWNKVVQWQQDDCAQQIETLFSDPASADTIYQAPIYYKRKDVETLEAVLEFVPRSIIVLILEDGSGDISDIKYHNTKRVTEEEWLDIFENWSRTLEDAERIFLTRVTRTKQPKKIFTMADKCDNSKEYKEAPEDYWGDWSSDEGSLQTKNTIYQRNPTGDNNNNNSTIKESDDSEDDYYTRWSQDPGTLTPNETPKRVLKSMDALQHSTSQLTMNQELEEEYDQSYNPLFTVPSVPNLMDAHTAALSELTHMLQASLPQQQQQQQQQQRSMNRNNVSLGMTQINPLPKAVSRLRAQQQEKEEEKEEEDQQQFPGAYPLSGTQSPVAQDPLLKEAGRSLFMKSLSALISAARLLGYDRQDILNMVQEIVNKQ